MFRRVVGAGVPLPLRSGLYWLLGNGGRQELWLVEQQALFPLAGWLVWSLMVMKRLNGFLPTDWQQGWCPGMARP